VSCPGRTSRDLVVPNPDTSSRRSWSVVRCGACPASRVEASEVSTDDYEPTYRWAVVYFWVASRRDDALRRGSVVVEAVIHGVPGGVDDKKLGKAIKSSAHAGLFSDYGHFLAHRRVVEYEKVSTQADESHRVDLDWGELA
jgi:hypothetical protein